MILIHSLQLNISINLDPPKLEYGNRRTLVPSRGVWRGEEMQFLSPQPGMKYSILNTNHRTMRNELNELAGMVSIILLSSAMLLALFF